MVHLINELKVGYLRSIKDTLEQMQKTQEATLLALAGLEGRVYKAFKANDLSINSLERESYPVS